MPAPRNKTSSFRMLVTPAIKKALQGQAGKRGMSGADYVAALIEADAKGLVAWGTTKNTRVAAGV